MKNNTICFIPARSGSKEIKDKNLKKIKGKTLVEITIELALNSKKFSKIIFSSDSSKMLNIAKKYNIVILKRSSKNSRDKSTTDEALLESLKKINFEYKNIIILQVTSPLRKMSTLKNFLNYCKKRKLKTCCTVTKIDEQIAYDGKFFDPLIEKKIRRRQKRKKFLYENSLMYFVEKNFFLKNKKIYPRKNWNYFITKKFESIDINNIDDFEITKSLYKKL